MKIHYLFRRPSPVFHSIEEQFFAMQKALPDGVKYKNVFAKYHSRGFFNRLGIAIQMAFNQGDVNHITGDIHFVALFLKKKKTILSVHDIGSILNKHGFKQKILRFVWFSMPFARVCKITVISEFTKSEILRQFNINPEKITVISDCVADDIAFSEKIFNVEKPNILQIGTKPNKNIERLIEAISGIACKLTIVGKLSDEQKRLLDKHKIDFKNAYNLSREEIIEAYKQADIVSFVSLYEGFGVPVLEAQATGRVVITSNLEPMNTVAGNGAYLVNPFDVQDINKAITEVIQNTDLRNSLIQHGFENIKNYSAKSVAEKYYQLYKLIYETPG